jgi:hypothetical protein
MVVGRFSESSAAFAFRSPALAAAAAALAT